MAILEVSNLKKIYTTRFGGNQVQALSDVVEPGEYVAIMGESGSGKTTLLNILAALDRPTSGDVILNGMHLSDVKEKQIATFRRDILDMCSRILIYLISLVFVIIFTFRWFLRGLATGKWSQD